MEKRITQQLEEKVTKAYLMAEHFKEREEEYKLQRNDVAVEITNLMNSMDITTYSFNAGDALGKHSSPTIITCNRIEPRTVEYDEPKLYDLLDKQLRNSLFTKTYEIADYEAMVELLKSHGVSPREFKKLITVKPKLNKEKLDKLYELGYITMKDVKGCYNVKKGKGYWRISAKKISDEKE